MAHERTHGIDALRSNPNVAGYGLTGAVDQVMCGEGLASTFRELKPQVIDEVGAALAPSRWCVFVSAQNVYRGDDVRIEVVLATDEDFAEAEPPVLVQIFDPRGAQCWHRATVVRIPTMAARQGRVTFPVLDEHIRLAGEPGLYTVLVTMQQGGAPTGGQAQVRLFERKPEREMLPVAVLGTHEQSARLAAVPGLAAYPWRSADRSSRDVLLVTTGATSEALDAARRAMISGASVVCLDCTDGYRHLTNRPSDDPAFEVSPIRSWLYQRDDWCRPHPLFDGLTAGGLLDWDRFRELITPMVSRPRPAAAVTPLAGVIRASQDYDAGLTTWIETVGSGQLLVSTLGIEDLLTQHPVADQLLYNAISVMRRT
jgi:hypothetical protein